MHMTIEERETLCLGLAQGHLLRARAMTLGRVSSSVSRDPLCHQGFLPRHAAGGGFLIAGVDLLNDANSMLVLGPSATSASNCG